jgi:hypothetical protein
MSLFTASAQAEQLSLAAVVFALVLSTETANDINNAAKIKSLRPDLFNVVIGETPLC